MSRVAANLTMLFTEAPALARPDLARGAGFDGAEVLFPYDFCASEWVRALDGLPVALINTPPGNWAAGERGWAAVPGAEARFRDSFNQALDYARQMQADVIHVLSGVAAGPEAEAVLRYNLRWASVRAPDQCLTLEPLNSQDMPGYFLHDFDQAARIIATLGIPQVGLQIDLWHVLRIGLQPDAIWRTHRALARHVQIAGSAARSEPDSAAIGWLHQIAPDYRGWIAAEYHPAAETIAGLDWLTRVRA